jgi:hypothetical protein
MLWPLWTLRYDRAMPVAQPHAVSQPTSGTATARPSRSVSYVKVRKIQWPGSRRPPSDLPEITLSFHHSYLYNFYVAIY